MIRRVLSAMAAATWLAGCVSILGVDPEDHRDVADVVCGCAGAGVRTDTCVATLASFLEDRPRVEDVVFECVVENERACAELDACLVEAGVCSPAGRDCTEALDPNGVNFRCCEGLTCQGGSCREEVAACVEPADACGDGDTCCGAASCISGSCCVEEDRVCAVEEDCCGQAICAGGTCQACSAQGEQCEDLPCCDPDDRCSITGFCGACDVLDAPCDPTGEGDSCCPGTVCVEGVCQLDL